MTEKQINLKDGSIIAYNDFNPSSTKTPLVMIQGMTGIKGDWIDTARDLAKLGDRRVIIYDHREIGSSHGDISSMTMSTLAADMVELVEKLGMTDVHLLGFSMGGMVAQTALLSEKRAFNIRKVVLAASALTFPPASQLPVDDIETVQQFTRKAFDEEWIAANSERLNRMMESCATERRPIPTMQAQARALGGCDTTQLFRDKDYAGRVYVLHGKRDALIPFAKAQHTLNTIQGSQLVKLPNDSLEFGHLFNFYFSSQIWSDALEACLVD
ncbi:hypothetical protein E3P99_03469 [Wallemia hederae]|uniref:AB hydrolase-1 domain-containing protein n=1 Tax=Wallemia hederae TaxID=1540922 RepID=A0A4T0FFP8_9BASI|nr:hypothetical protein E3P99_03469 [Wallemia hederae]